MRHFERTGDYWPRAPLLRIPYLFSVFVAWLVIWHVYINSIVVVLVIFHIRLVPCYPTALYSIMNFCSQLSQQQVMVPCLACQKWYIAAVVAILYGKCKNNQILMADRKCEIVLNL